MRFTTYYVLNSLINGARGVTAIPTGMPLDKPQADGHYFLLDGEDDGRGPYDSVEDAREAAESIVNTEWWDMSVGELPRPIMIGQEAEGDLVRIEKIGDGRFRWRAPWIVRDADDRRLVQGPRPRGPRLPRRTHEDGGLTLDLGRLRVLVGTLGLDPTIFSHLPPEQEAEALVEFCRGLAERHDRAGFTLEDHLRAIDPTTRDPEKIARLPPGRGLSPRGRAR